MFPFCVTKTYFNGKNGTLNGYIEDTLTNHKNSQISSNKMLLQKLKESSYVKLAKLHANPVIVNVVVLRVIENPHPKPLTFSVVMLEDVTIPYIFKKPGPNSSNTITSPVEGEVPIVFSAGVESHYFSMYKAPKIVEGGFYRMEDVYFEVYASAKDPNLGRSFTCARMTPVHVPDIQAVMCKIPFESRSIDMNRDIPGDDRLLYVSNKQDKNHFVYVKVGPQHESDGDIVYGKFTPPAPGQPVVSMYVPKMKSKVGSNGVPSAAQESVAPVIALTGGRISDSVVDNQFMLQQNKSGDASLVIMGFTKLFGESLYRLQVDWQQFAGILIPCLEGDGFSLINREKTRDLVVDNPDFVGAVSLSTYFHPKLSAMMRNVGFKLNWENCVKLAPQLKTPSIMRSERPQINLTWADGINILEFAGDVSLLKQASDEGYVELYALTNCPFTPQKRMDMQKRNQLDIIAHLCDDGEYCNGPRVTAIFAICTALSEYPIKDYVAAPHRTPVAMKMFETKNVKRNHTEECDKEEFDDM